MTPINIPKYCNPWDGNPQKDIPNFGKPPRKFGAVGPFLGDPSNKDSHVIGGCLLGSPRCGSNFCYDYCLYSTGHVDMRLMDETIGREAFAVPAEITAK